MTEAPQDQGQQAPESGESVAESFAETASTASKSQQDERTFTQQDLTKIAANEKREGKQSAISELLEQAGAESVEEILQGYDSYRGIQEEITTEADKEKGRAERWEKQARQAEERYTSTLREYALRDALRDAGINPERIRSAMRIAEMSALEVDKEGNVSGIEDVVAAVRRDVPEIFADSSARQQRSLANAPQTNPAGAVRPGQSTGDPQQDMGRSMFAWLTEPVPEDDQSWP